MGNRCSVRAFLFSASPLKVRFNTRMTARFEAPAAMYYDQSVILISQIIRKEIKIIKIIALMKGGIAAEGDA